MNQKYVSGARWLAFGLVVLVGAPVLVGCGSSTAKITGKVTLSGEPLGSGTITFFGKEGTEPGQGTINDGNYIVHAAPIGECKVTVVTVPTPATASGGGGGMMGGGTVKIGGEKVLKEGSKAKEGSEQYKDKQGEMMGKLKKMGGQDPSEMIKPTKAVNTKYHKKDTTDLTHTVKKGANDGVNFDLKE